MSSQARQQAQHKAERERLRQALSFPVGYFTHSSFASDITTWEHSVQNCPDHITLNQMKEFQLWPELATGKLEVCDLPLCKVLLMDDANYPCWLVLVPRRNGLREVIDLPPELQQQMWQEVAVASQAVQELYQPFKLNIAAIGNVVSQLHVHVTGRLQGDPSWPGPCYGAVPAKLLEASTAAGMVKALQDYFAAAKGRSSS